MWQKSDPSPDPQLPPAAAAAVPATAEAQSTCRGCWTGVQVCAPPYYESTCDQNQYWFYTN